MKKSFLWAAVVAMSLPATTLRAGVAYSDPDGGWSYLYTGDEVAGEDAFASLDGTWDHENGSDAWDGFPIDGDNSAPGGVNSITEDEVTFARFDDTGDPRNDGFDDPSNRKIYLTHDISDDDPDGDLVQAGITLTFRARLATTGLFENTFVEEGVGDGYYILDGGKGTFTVRSANAGQSTISFALSTSVGDDLAENESGALLMNRYDELGGTEVDTTDGGGEHREVAVADPTAWNEFWITIQEAGELNQYEVNVYSNGSTTPETLTVTGGDGNDGAFGSYLGMGVHSTGQHGTIDVDFFGYKPGILVPSGGGGLTGDFNNDKVLDAADINLLQTEVSKGTNDKAYDLNNDNLVNLTDQQAWVHDVKKTWVGDANLDGEFNSGDLVSVFTLGKYETGQIALWQEGDWNADLAFNSGDFVAAFSDGGYEIGPRPAIAAVPEPASLLLTALGALLLLGRRRSA
jgi:hypothetical protein